MKTIFSDSFKEELKRKDTTLRLTKYFLKSSSNLTYTKEELLTLSEDLLSSTVVHEVAGIWENINNILKLYISADLSSGIVWKMIYVLYQNNLGKEDIAFVLLPDATNFLPITNNLEILDDLDICENNLVEVKIENIKASLVVPCSLDTKFLESEGIEKGLSVFLPDNDSRLKQKPQDRTLVTVSSFKKYSAISRGGDDYIDTQSYINSSGEIEVKGRIERRVIECYIDTYNARTTSPTIRPKKVKLDIPFEGEEVKIVGSYLWEEYYITDDGKEKLIGTGVSDLDSLTEGEFRIVLAAGSSMDYKSDYLKKTITIFKNPIPFAFQRLTVIIELNGEAISNYLEISQGVTELECSIEKSSEFKEEVSNNIFFDLYLLDWKKDSKEEFKIINNFNIRSEDIKISYNEEILPWVGFEVINTEESELKVTITTKESNEKSIYTPSVWDRTGHINNLVNINYIFNGEERHLYSFYVVQKQKTSGLDVYQKKNGKFTQVTELEIDPKIKESELLFVYPKGDGTSSGINYWKIVYTDKEEGIEIDNSTTSGTIYTIPSKGDIDGSKAVKFLFTKENDSVNNIYTNPTKIIRTSNPSSTINLTNWKEVARLFILDLETVITGTTPIIEVEDAIKNNGITFEELSAKRLVIRSNCKFKCEIDNPSNGFFKFDFSETGNNVYESDDFDLNLGKSVYIETTTLYISSNQDVATLKITNLEGNKDISIDVKLKVTEFDLTNNKLNITPSANKDNKFSISESDKGVINYLFLGNNPYNLIYSTRRSIGLNLYKSSTIGHVGSVLSEIKNNFIETTSEGIRYSNTQISLERSNKNLRLYPTSIVGYVDIAGYKGANNLLLDPSESIHINGYIFEACQPPKLIKRNNSTSVILSYSSGSSYDYTFESLYPVTNDDIVITPAKGSISCILFTQNDVPGNYKYSLRITTSSENTENSQKEIGKVEIISRISKNNFIDISSFSDNDINTKALDLINNLKSSSSTIDSITGTDSISLTIHQRGKTISDISNEGNIIGSSLAVASIGERREYSISASGSIRVEVEDQKSCDVEIDENNRKLIVNFFSKYPDNGTVPGVFDLGPADSDEKANKYIKLSEDRKVGFVANIIRRINGEDKKKRIDTYSSIDQPGFKSGILYRSDTILNKLFVNYGNIQETLKNSDSKLEFASGIFDITKKITIGREGETPNVTLLGELTSDGRIVSTDSDIKINNSFNPRVPVPKFSNTGDYNISIRFPKNTSIEDKTYRFRIGSGSYYIFLDVTLEGVGYSVYSSDPFPNDCNIIFHASGKYRDLVVENGETKVNYLDSVEIPFITNLPADILRNNCIRYVRKVGEEFVDVEGRINNLTLQRVENTSYGEKYKLILSLVPNTSELISEEYIAIFDDSGKNLWKGKIYQGFCRCGISNPHNHNVYYRGDISTIDNPIPLGGGRNSWENGEVILSMVNYLEELKLEHYEISEISNDGINYNIISLRDNFKEIELSNIEWTIPIGSNNFMTSEYLEDSKTELVIEDEKLSNKVPYIKNSFKVKVSEYYTEFMIKVFFDITIPYVDIPGNTDPIPFCAVYNKLEANKPSLSIGIEGGDIPVFSSKESILRLNITCNTDYELTFDPEDMSKWVTKQEPEGTYNYIFKIAENKGETREGYIRIKTTEPNQVTQDEKEILIKQEGKSN